MKLFWKIFSVVFISLFVIALSISYIISSKQISYMENHLIEENRIIGSLISKEVEIGYLESKWPFESLRKLSEQENFLFWWVIKDDGLIHLSDNSSFMGTYAYDYFPQVINIAENEDIFIDYKQSYGIYFQTFGTGENKQSFWLGFSLKDISETKRDVILLTIISSLLALTILGAITYFIIKHFTNPINELTICANKIKQGNLDKKCEVKSKDELEELAKAFDEMRLGLKDRNDLLNSLLKTFQGKFGNLATILVRKNIQELVKKNPRIEKILPKSLGITITKAKRFQRERESRKKT